MCSDSFSFLDQGVKVSLTPCFISALSPRHFGTLIQEGTRGEIEKVFTESLGGRMQRL